MHMVVLGISLEGWLLVLMVCAPFPDMEDGTPPPGRKVMVVADPTPKSAAALQYALSHVVLEKDEMVLINIESLGTWKNPLVYLKRSPNLSHAGEHSFSAPLPERTCSIGGAGDQVDFLEQMKRVCEIAHPNIHVRTERIEIGCKDKANAILSRSVALGVDLIIIGQRRSLSAAILGRTKSKSSISGSRIMDTAEYLIENSQCTCVAVQKKGLNPGFLLNTKTHKNFWLLA